MTLQSHSCACIWRKAWSERIHASVFTAALFTMAKMWKQPKSPSTEEWIKKMWHMHTVGYHSAIKKTEIMPFAATWMDLESAILSLSKWSQRRRNIVWHPLYVGSKKKWYKGTYKTEIYVWLSPFTVQLKLSQHCLLIGYITIQNKK